jgi:hypothetical protein
MTRQTAAWYATWIIPSTVCLIGIVTIERWLPEPFPQTLTVDEENARFCAKFSAPAPGDQQSCTNDLLQLRARDQALDLL